MEDMDISLALPPTIIFHVRLSVKSCLPIPFIWCFDLPASVSNRSTITSLLLLISLSALPPSITRKTCSLLFLTDSGHSKEDGIWTEKKNTLTKRRQTSLISTVTAAAAAAEGGSVAARANNYIYAPNLGRLFDNSCTWPTVRHVTRVRGHLPPARNWYGEGKTVEVCATWLRVSHCYHIMFHLLHLFCCWAVASAKRMEKSPTWSEAGNFLLAGKSSAP